jgi:2-aminoadipate transaminase
MFSNRISNVPKSFIREILKVSTDPSIISFAGGLPNKDLFPVENIKEATNKVFDLVGPNIFQYSNSEGYKGLREIIAKRYKSFYSLDIPIDNILITNGSQQGLDLLGKIFINEGDSIAIEEPGYLGAIQAFGVYKSKFLPVPVYEGGMDVDALKSVLTDNNPKLIYTVPNFQNPSGITYTNKIREEVAAVIDGREIYLIEDNPYAELRFSGDNKKSFKELLPQQTILLGTVSKTIVPSFRLGWIVAPDNVMEKLLVAKQASDLHTNYFCQRIVDQFLRDYSLDDHIEKIKSLYGSKKIKMIEVIKKYFPKEIKFTDPEGGMFLWVTLPEGMSSMDLFDRAIKRNVAFVPGNPFYTDNTQKKGCINTFRLNYTNSDTETIEKGIILLADCIKEML